MTKNYFDLVLKIILILVGVLIIYWFFELIFGGSPSLSQFNSALIIMVVGILFKVYRELGEISVGVKHGFSKIRNDLDLIKQTGGKK